MMRADDEAFALKRAEIIFRVAGQQRQHDAEADQVNEDRQENDERLTACVSFAKLKFNCCGQN